MSVCKPSWMIQCTCNNWYFGLSDFTECVVKEEHNQHDKHDKSETDFAETSAWMQYLQGTLCNWTLNSGLISDRGKEHCSILHRRKCEKSEFRMLHLHDARVILLLQHYRTSARYINTDKAMKQKEIARSAFCFFVLRGTVE